MPAKKLINKFEKFLKDFENEVTKFKPQEDKWQQFIDETFEFEKEINAFATLLKELNTLPERDQFEIIFMQSMPMMQRGTVYLHSSDNFLKTIKELMLARSVLLKAWAAEVKAFAPHNLDKHLRVLIKLRENYAPISKSLLPKIEEIRLYLVSEKKELHDFYYANSN